MVRVLDCQLTFCSGSLQEFRSKLQAARQLLPELRVQRKELLEAVKVHLWHLLSGIRYALMQYFIFLTFTEWMKTGRALKQRVVNCDRVVLKQNVKGGKTLRRSDGRQETI